jgi:hypothetical protein
MSGMDLLKDLDPVQASMNLDLQHNFEKRIWAQKSK